MQQDIRAVEDELNQKSPSQFANSQFDFSWIEKISFPTIIRLLVEKNILTPNEIIEKERKLRLSAKNESDASRKHSNHHHRSPIKNFAAQYRWSRYLTSKLLGWHWKKSKTRIEESQDLS